MYALSAELFVKEEATCSASGILWWPTVRGAPSPAVEEGEDDDEHHDAGADVLVRHLSCLRCKNTIPRRAGRCMHAVSALNYLYLQLSKCQRAI